MRLMIPVRVGRSFGIVFPTSSRLLALTIAAFLVFYAGNSSPAPVMAEITHSHTHMDGEDDETPDPPHPQPQITNFRVITDGLDNYEVSGTVINCDNVELLEVQFDGAFAGATAYTGMFGDFKKLLYLPGYSGYEVSAIVTCHEGEVSDRAFAFLP